MDTVLLESAGKREFAKTVAHHVLSDEHRVENLAVMHVKCQPHKVWCDH